MKILWYQQSKHGAKPKTIEYVKDPITATVDIIATDNILFFVMKFPTIFGLIIFLFARKPIIASNKNKTDPTENNWFITWFILLHRYSASCFFG